MKMKRKEPPKQSLTHNNARKLAIDFGSTAVTGILKLMVIFVFLTATSSCKVSGEVEVRDVKSTRSKPFVWESEVPKDCPFEQSETLTGIFFTGRHSDYHLGDTFYPTWASDGNMYSPWTDGVGCSSGGSLKRGFHTAHVVMIGDDPLKLDIKDTSPPKRGWAKPYRGRYPSASLVHNGIWYYGTYCLGPGATYMHSGFKWNFPNLGPMSGYQISYDLGKTWIDSPHTPENPLFPESAKEPRY